jgi:carboxymethylenebutenolidase
MRTSLLIALVLSLASVASAATPPIAPGAEDAENRLKESPRHGEWQDISLPGSETKIHSWVVYPEKKDKAGVVIVIHEIFGMTDWVRSVADQLAADGFIAIAPDFLSGKGAKGGGTEEIGEKNVRAAIQKLTPEEVNARLDAVAAHARKDPAANGKVATIGFCWGGAASFKYATHAKDLNGAVVYYGAAPRKAPPDNDKVDADALKAIACPVLGHYGGDDARVNSTIDEAKKSSPTPASLTKRTSTTAPATASCANSPAARPTSRPPSRHGPNPSQSSRKTSSRATARCYQNPTGLRRRES